MAFDPITAIAVANGLISLGARALEIVHRKQTGGVVTKEDEAWLDALAAERHATAARLDAKLQAIIDGSHPTDLDRPDDGLSDDPVPTER